MSILIYTRQIGQLQTGTWAGFGCNPGDPSADKDPLKAHNPKITAKPPFGLIESLPSSDIMEIANNIGRHLA